MRHVSHPMRNLLMLAAALVLFRGAITSAQSTDTPDATTSKNVYIHDSGVATEKLALAQRMEHLSEWGKAADIYQEMLATLGDRLVVRPPAQGSHAPHDVIYTSVKLAVQEHISHWPPDALQFYRDRYEAAAAADLAKASAPDSPLADPVALYSVFDNFFVTQSGKRAGLMLIEQDMEGGDFAAALLVARRLLDLHPTLAEDRALVLHRAALAAHLAGDDQAAHAFAKELHDRFGGAVGKVRGQDVKLADSIDAELSRISPAADIADAAGGRTWPMAFGSPDRDAIPAAPAPGGFAKLYSIPLAEPLMPGIPAAPQRHEQQMEFEREKPSGAFTGIFPVVDQGQLFFQDNARVYAVSLDSGLPLPGWLQSYPETQGRFTLRAWSPLKDQQCTVTLTDQSVLAIMAQPDQRETNLSGTILHTAELLCLDRQTGRVRWSAAPSEFPAVPTALRQLELCGSPLVVGPNVYLTARGGRGTQFEDCYVICLDSATGHFRWATYLASAGSDLQIFDMEIGGSGGQNVSHLAYAGGLIYACSNVGAAAAVDALSGSVVWLDLYPRQEEPMVAFQFRQRFAAASAMAWTFNPVIVAGSRVFMLPADGTHLSIYDSGSGAVVDRIPLAKFDNPNTLVGITGDHLLVASPRSVWDIDWPNFRPDPPMPDAPIAADDLCHWEQNIAPEHSATDGGAPAVDAIVGRPFLTASKLYVSTPSSLIPFDIHSGRREAPYPATGSLDDDEGPGNVLVCSDHVIVAGADKLVVYTNLAAAVAKLDAKIAAAPTDPEPRLLCAEILFVAGNLTDSVARLDQAAAILRGQSPDNAPGPTTAPAAAPAMATGPMRDRLFVDTLTFARKLQADERLSNGALIDPLYDRAAAAASSPVQLVTYALRRAEWAGASSQPSVELRLLQALLLDPRQRAIMIGDGDDAGQPAGTVAKVRIDALLAEHRRGIYVDIERDAVDSFKRLQRDSAPPAALVELAEAYPNSSIAPDALLQAAAASDASGDIRAAAAARRRWLQAFGATSPRPRVLEDLARDYLAIPGRLPAAAAELTAGAKPLIGFTGPAAATQPGHPEVDYGAAAAWVEPRLQGTLRLPDGRVLSNLTFSQAAKQIADAAQTQPLVLPDPAFRPFQRHGPGPRSFDPFAAEAPDSIVDATALVPPLAGTSVAGGNADDLGYPVSPVVGAPAASAFGNRMIVSTPGTGMAVYAGGSPKPLMICSTVPPQVRAAGFVGDSVLLACDDRLMRVNAAGEVVWDLPLHEMPDLQVAILGPAPGHVAEPQAVQADTDNPAADARARIIARRQFFAANGVQIMPGNPMIMQQAIALQAAGQAAVIVNGQVVAVGRGAAARQPGLPDEAAAGAAPETIVKAVAAGNRLVAATSAGRVLSVDQLTGHVVWQTRLEDTEIDQLVADDDFVALRAGAAAVSAGEQSAARIVVFDADDGHVQYQHVFNTDVASPPVNMALAPDGALVWLLQDQICAKDLLEPGEHLRFQTYPWDQTNNPNQPHEANAYVFSREGTGSASQPDQLVIDGQRIITVAEGGAILRAFDLTDGRPLALPSGLRRINLSGGESRWAVHIRAAGNGVYYAVNPICVNRFDFEPTAGAAPALNWEWPPAPDLANRHVVDDIALTRNQMVVFYEPAPHVTGQSDRARLWIDCVNPADAYIELQKKNLTDAAGIRDYRLVDGGLYYRTGDDRLHFLPGAAAK